MSIKRFDETSDILEASFLVQFDSFETLDASKNALQNLSESVKVSFLDSRGMA